MVLPGVERTGWNLVTAAVFFWSLCTAAGASQTSFQLSAMSANEHKQKHGWRVSVSDDWDVLGPFPIHAREQHFLSPSFPLNLSRQIDLEDRWPSAYADGGTVGWTKAVSDKGDLRVSFLDIRWESLRATEGWAALQHHSVLRTTVTVYPPSSAIKSTTPPRLLMSFLQASFFTIRPSTSDRETKEFIPKWYTGNIYAMTAAPSQSVELPIAPSTSEPTSYDLFVSGDYEIRLFGDPIARKSQIPELRITAAVEIDELTPALALEESHHVVPDFVGGWAFGSALGVGLRSIDGWWTITNVSLVSDIAAVFNVQLLKETRLAPSQTRILPLRLIQTGVFKGPTIQFELTAASSHSTTTIPITLTVNHHSQWRTDAFSYLTATFFFATSMPTAFIVIPPIHKNEKRILPPVLALHGAGVDVINMPFFAEALPRQKRSWVVIPAGRTAWGLDWHGPSAQDALATVDSLHDILEARSEWHAWKTEADSRVLLIGHSNGGQGAWYMASRFPDRIIGAIPAAGYIKSQSYVPFVQSRSAHFIDPAVRAILETALTPDDNELFISNLVDTPVLAIHGGDDDNVPVWHTRQLVDVLKTWHPNANVTYQEDPGQPHFYPNMFLTRSVQDFIDSAFEQSFDHNHPADFTLTVAIPSDSGSLHGFRIEALQIPGRLGRLTVQSGDNRVIIKTSNVRTFAIGGPQTLTSGGLPVLVDNQEVNTNVLSNDAIVYICKRDGRWQILSNPTTSLRTPTGRLSNILTTLGSINIVIPDAPTPSALSVAKRIAHDLNLYHKLDTDVLYASEASARLQQGSLGPGNVVVVGGSTNSLAKALLLQHKTPFSLSANILTLNGEVVDKSAAALFLHPHPESAAGLVLLMYADTEDALERAGRLFPIRTGVTVPDWLVIGNAADKIGAAGVLGAGVWGHEWTWNEALSSF